MTPSSAPPRPSGHAVVRQMAACAVRVVVLLLDRRLHRHPEAVGSVAHLPDGRRFVLFRKTSCEQDDDSHPVVLAVWFHLRWVPARARVRRYLFERESILNTILYAGFDGYLVKLWMVDPETSDYAGLYQWNGYPAAERYARYITAVLRPLSTPGSVGYELVDGVRLDDHLRSTGDL
jgi:hypothetical protein